jgi:polygalacturonase
MHRSDNVTIKDSNINNGDDCVSFKPSQSSRNILVLRNTKHSTRCH